MKPAPFEYHAPGTVAEAVALLDRLGDDAKVLAGGQSLVPIMALRLARFDHLVDLNGVDELRYVRADGDVLSVGAMTVQATLEHDPVVAGAAPLIARAVRHVGHFQIRNRGTIGGSCAHADPAAELPAVAVTLDAEFELVGPAGARRVAAADFFESTFMTVLAPDEVIAAVHFPLWTGRCGFAVREFARRRGDFALAGALCGIALDDGGRVRRAAVGLLALGSTPLRAAAAERALVGTRAADVDPAELGALALADADPPSDVHADGEYRRRIGAVLVADTLSAAIEEARSD
jgi:aerobic carbon-monoxide dehydrogenase medium subunit